MNPSLPTVMDWPAPAALAETADAPARFGPSSCLMIGAGFLTPFTISLVGEIPVGELVLLLVAGWAGLCALVHRASPGPLFHRRYLAVLLACELVALLAYVCSDLYRHSAPRDMARGWARLILLAIDVVALAYLLGRSRHNLLWFLAGQLAGEMASTALFGALFDDAWKFGYGVPVTYAVILLASLTGPVGVVLAAGGLGALHFAMDFRSLGGLCLLLAGITILHLLAPRARLWALPCCVFATLAIATFLFTHVRDGDDMAHRASRSDVERTAMIRATFEAFRASPLIGQGSWFSRSKVYEDFAQIRDDLAKEAGIGGFAGPNEEPETVGLHSQILVTLAEGGILGGAFFFAYAAGLLGALWDQVMVQPWRRELPVRVFVLVLACWNLAMSPFSGAHRVYIALAAGLVLLVQAERTPEEPA